MDEQPVALAIFIRSPKSCDSSLRYGVSPHPRASAGEFEQRLEELHAAHVGEIHPRAIVHRQALEECRILARRLHQRRLVHVDGLDAGLDCALGRTGFDARGRTLCNPPHRTARLKLTSG